MRRVRTAFVIAFLLVLGAFTIAGCGGQDAAEQPPVAEAPAPTTPTAPPQTAPATPAPAPETAPQAPEPTPAPAPEPLPGLPDDTAGFEDWPTLNTEPIPPNSPASQRVGFDAHLGTKDVHVTAGPGPDGVYPEGAIIVKAARDGDRVTLVAVMRKVAGFDPEHGDWEYIEWKRAAGVEAFATEPRLSGATCWSCHAGAQATDWVFTPDER